MDHEETPNDTQLEIGKGHLTTLEDDPCGEGTSRIGFGTRGSAGGRATRPRWAGGADDHALRSRGGLPRRSEDVRRARIVRGDDA